MENNQTRGSLLMDQPGRRRKDMLNIRMALAISISKGVVEIQESRIQRSESQSQLLQCPFNKFGVTEINVLMDIRSTRLANRSKSASHCCSE